MSWKNHATRDPLIYLTERTWRTESGCWLWLLGVDRNGYGRMRLPDRTRVMAHRFAYESLVGPLADGQVVDHLCATPSCVNPQHLDAVTPSENNRRSASPSARNSRKTECMNGHPFDEANTYRRPDGDRACRACHAATNASLRARRRANAS